MSSQHSDDIDFVTGGDGSTEKFFPSSSAAAAASGEGAGGSGTGEMDDEAEIEAMKVRMAEMEAEAAKLREMQADAEGSSGGAAAGPSEEEKEEVDSRSVYVGNVSRESCLGRDACWKEHVSGGSAFLLKEAELNLVAG